MAEYKAPNNSFANKGVSAPEAKPEVPKINKVVQGEVILKEKSKFERVKENGKNAVKNVMVNTVSPSIKDLILNTVWSWLSMMFFPDGSRRPSNTSSPARMVTYSNYGSYFDRSGATKPKAVTNIVESVFKNPLMASMQDADAVLDCLRDQIAVNGYVTWATLYDLCGMDNANWQGATKYGWTSVESTMISAVRMADGDIRYEMRMPKCMPIEDVIQ